MAHRTEKFSPVFQQMLDAPVTSLAALRDDADTFERFALDLEGKSHLADAAIPYRDVLGFLLFDAAGNPVPIEQQEWVPQFARLEDLKTFVDPRSADGRLLHLPREGNLPVFGLWAPYDETERWNLPASFRSLAGQHENCTVALFAGNDSRPLEGAVASFGLSALCQRVAIEVVRTGSIREASKSLGIAYATAREAMVETARRMHLPNTPAVVRTVVAAGFGILPGAMDAATQLADMLCITDRQAQIALLISSGSTREQAAYALGASTAVIKKELQALFTMFGLQSAVELARLITEAQALRLFARSINNAPGFLDPAIEPSRYMVRPNGRGVFGLSDYGPASARPVLVVHSNWCCRAVPRPLLSQLQQNGWRPIAIDRPGFGASQLGASTRENPFTQAIDDVLQFLDSARIDTIPIIARCGAQFVHAFKSAAPDRVGPVLLVSPTPPASSAGKRFGAVGAFKEAFYRSPRLVEMFFRVISAQFTFERVNYLMRTITRGCLVDERLCDDPQFLRDRFRALRPFTTGNYMGGIYEEMVISHGGWSFKPLVAHDWVVLQGEDDPHHSFEEVHDYWSAVLPNVPFEKVAGGGRFLTNSHADLVVNKLDALSCGRVPRGGVRRFP